MRALLMVLAAVAGLSVSSPAQASRGVSRVQHHFGHYLAERHRHVHWRYSRHLRHLARPVVRVVHYSRTYGALPGPCRTAAAMGGPCGCWAGHVLLGTTAHVWRGINLWLANDWLRFPHVAAAPGTAAVWPGRHVAPVVAVHGAVVIVRDSWATHPVRTAGLVFVQPYRLSSLRRTGWRFTGGIPL